MASVRVWFFLILTLAAWAETPQQIYKRARKAEKQGDILRAYALYTQASFLDPKNPEYEGRSMALRTTALGDAKVTLPQAKDLAPDTTGAKISDEDLADMKRLTAPPELKGNPGKRDFALNGTARQLFEQVTKAYGMDVVFDGDYDTGGNGAPDRPYPFTLTQVTWQEALHVLQVITNSFVSPLGDKLMMAVRDTPQKRTEQEPNMAVLVPIPEGLADAQELARSVQQVMELQKFAVDNTRKLVYMRGPISKVRPAIMLFNQLAERRGQVAIEVELFEVITGSTLEYGIGLPTASQLRSVARIWNFLSPVSTTLTRLLTFGGGASLLGIGVIDAQLFASMSRNQSSSKLKAEIRTMDNFPANFVVGDKYPIITNQYIGSAGAQTGTRFAPPPSIQFEDLGLTLKITPRIHNTEEISLEVESEFKVLTGQAQNGIPVISTRKYQGKVRLREGEWGIVAGLVNMSDTNSRSGIPIVSAVPGIGSRSKETRRGQTLLVIRPRLVGAPVSETVLGPLWVGPEAKLRTLF
ncbi:MAG: hypothetical protein K2X03_10125 [Bryobacteraceae bacterium]|nr:hypothetical protein [Bryobacteraceae bacterium]